MNTLQSTLAYCYRRLVCLCVGNTGKACKKGWTDWDAVWLVTSVKVKMYYMGSRGKWPFDFTASCSAAFSDHGHHDFPTRYWAAIHFVGLWHTQVCV